MRKLTVGLMMMVGLLAVTPPAMAQVVPGSADPVGLITSGAVIPFLGTGLADGPMSFLELYAPVGSTEVHMFLFDANCVRGGPSINVPLTANDMALLRVDNIGSGAPTFGLITAGKADAAGFTLFPWAPSEAVAVRTLFASSVGNYVRVIDPIALATIDDPVPTGTGGWHPMRTSAAFFAPLDGTAGLNTNIYFVCPNTNIQRHTPSNGGALNPTNGFPIIFPGLQLAGQTTPLRIRIYNDDEDLLRDVTTSCNCLTIKRVTDIDLVYSSIVDAPDGTYTEVEGGTQAGVPAVCSTSVEPLTTPDKANSGNACPGAPLGCTFTEGGGCTGQFQQTTPPIPASGPFSFVAYRSITVPGFDVFNRVPGASVCHIRGAADDACLLAPPDGVANTGGR